MKHRAKRMPRPVPAMNVTPLVDIVLVLLIVFMVVMPSMESQAAVELPAMRNIDDEPEGRLDPITVSVGLGDTLVLEAGGPDDGVVASLDDLEAHLRSLHRASPHRRVLLRGDRALSYRSVREVFAMCQRAGLPGVSLRVNQLTSGGPGRGL